MEKNRKLKVMAVAAPHWVSDGGSSGHHAFNSMVPFSLQNALRGAVEQAVYGDGAWSLSNFSDWKERNDAVVLMEYWMEQKDLFIERFKRINPDILLIGAMTLSLPGAVELAREAKNLKNKNVFIVLGGKHCNETFYKEGDRFVHLAGSPLRLMNEGKIPPLFDLVFSGDGEMAIVEIGEIIFKLLQRKLPFDKFSKYKVRFEGADGDWVAGQMLENNQIAYYEGKGGNIDYTQMGIAVEQFELKGSFGVFDTDLTGHVYSDVSKGCPFNCYFCSEKSYINGKLRMKSDLPVKQLVRQFAAAKELEKTRYAGKSLSLFVEDSIFLAGNAKLIDLFYETLLEKNITVPFGCQFTIDTFLFLSASSHIDKLKEVGLRYVAFGVETIDEEIARKFSKNTDKKERWIRKIELVVRKCREYNLTCGMFLLWGLGEVQESREYMLRMIIQWMQNFEVKIEVGLNIATRHPLRKYQDDNYLQWGTDENSPYLNSFVSYFGEASEKYRLSDDNYPTIDQLNRLTGMFMAIKHEKWLH